MAFTRHGHHIEGTEIGPRPEAVARCGGPAMCRVCLYDKTHFSKKEVEGHEVYVENGGPVMIVSEGTRNPGTDMLPVDPIEKIKKDVRQVVDFDFLRKRTSDNEVQAPYTVYVVTFAYILGGWKATAATDISDGKYFEVTYNAAKQETYVDMYLKELNVVIPDTAPKN